MAQGMSPLCATADIDRNGFVDIVVVVVVPSAGGAVIDLYLNRGGFDFVRADGGVGPRALPNPLNMGLGLWDYDRDGWIDVFLGQYLGGKVTELPDCHFISDADFVCPIPTALGFPPPRIYHNDHGTLTLAEGVFGGPFPGTTNAVAFSDLNRDGLTDVFMSNDWYVNHVQHARSGGGFEHAERDYGVDRFNHGMGAAIADFNGDGHLDVYGADLGLNNLWFGGANAKMKNRALDLGIAAATRYHSNWGPVAADFDLDGWSDVFVTAAAVVDNEDDLARIGLGLKALSLVPQHDLLFWNEQGNGFSSQQLPHRDGDEPFVVMGGSATADVDKDGDLDIAVASGAPPQFRFLRNDQSPGSYLVVDLEGTTSNRDGIGAEVTLKEGGQVIALRTVGSQGSIAQSWHRAHFGLAGRSQIEEVQVRWPSGTIQVLGPVAANQVVLVTEP
jgi:hypothetical protein